MVKLKAQTGAKNKGKRAASSSSTPKQPRARKQSKLVIHEVKTEPLNEEPTVHPAKLYREQMERESQARKANPCTKPDWKGGSLDIIDNQWQADLFDWKMDKNKDRKDGFMCEKDICIEHFTPFGLVQKFEALGWEAALKCYDGETNKIYMEAIQEWVGSLQMHPGSKPPETMMLSGWVDDVQVTMSFETLNEIAKFDSKEGRYVYPTEAELYHPEKSKKWKSMLKDVLEPGKGKGKRIRKDELKLPLNLLLTFVQQNVMPRRSDRTGVRFPDVPILQCLMRGKPKISYRYLVMMNIWTSRNNREKWSIPHCRLITALLKKHGAIDGTSEFLTLKKGHTPITLDRLGTYGWEYVKTDRYHKLKNGGRKWRALRPDARMLLEGEEDEAESGDSAMGDSDGEDAIDAVAGGDGIGTNTGVDVEPVLSQFGGSQHFSGRDYQDIEEVIEQARPEDWSTWPGYAQAIFDQNTRHNEQQRRDTQRVYDRNEHWHRVHAYNAQREINHRFQDDQARRMHEAWLKGEEVVKYPPVVDYTTIAPYDGSIQRPVPQVHHSEWVDPIQDEQHMQGEGSSEGAAGFGEMRNTMRGVFGDPQPRYY